MKNNSLIMLIRSILLFIFLIFFSLNSFSETVQLLLIRDDKFNLICEKSVIHGKLYGVPSPLELRNIESNLGLEFITETQELPFENNEISRSAIPVGIYRAEVRKDKTKNWMITNPQRAWRLELKNTHPRSAIQFHYGKDYTWSQGCIILTGKISNPLFCQDPNQNSSDIALSKLRQYIESRIKKSSDEITIKIMNNK